MSVFIGWSGKSTKSHQVAEALRDWLGQVIQGCDPWISTVDIDDPLQSIRHERAGSQKSPWDAGPFHEQFLFRDGKRRYCFSRQRELCCLRSTRSAGHRHFWLCSSAIGLLHGRYQTGRKHKDFFDVLKCALDNRGFMPIAEIEPGAKLNRLNSAMNWRTA